MVGRPLYEAFVKEYTEKHWGRKATELPAFIIARLPVRYTYDTNYYASKWQGIPTDGYGAWFRRMLDHPDIEVRLGTDFFAVRENLPKHDLLVYTGAIDQFFGYRHGRLNWRSVRFEKEVKDVPNYLGTATINQCDASVPYTRIHEYRHFTPGREFERTIVHREYSYSPGPDDDCDYPIGSPEDSAKLAAYREEAAATCPQIQFGGRLGQYAYLDMDKAIAAALGDFRRLLRLHGPGI